VVRLWARGPHPWTGAGACAGHQDRGGGQASIVELSLHGGQRRQGKESRVELRVVN
jgi:hypothetical protein